MDSFARSAGRRSPSLMNAKSGEGVENAGWGEEGRGKIMRVFLVYLKPDKYFL